MASFRQRNNKWQARVSRDGYPDQVKTFDAKSDAERWARSVESEMDKGLFVNTQEAQRTTLRELILRYVREVTPTMKSVPDTKNGTPRTVPLSTAAVELLKSLPRNISGEVFPLKYFTLDAAFKRAVRRAGLIDFHFHDLRHTAITAMAEKLPNLIELSAVTGHKSLSMLKRYYHPSIEVLARKLG